MRKEIVLALGGGGARGLAHIGILEALEARKIGVRAVMGTSMGAVVGGLYCAGMSPGEIHDLMAAYIRRKKHGFLGVPRMINTKARTPLGILARNIRQRLLVNISVNRISLFSLKNLVRFIDAVIPEAHIQDLPRPFAALSNDILTGRDVILERGDLRTAVLASANIPGFFPPVPLDGMLLVDAGITQMVPVEAARKCFGGPVWAVDVSQDLEPMTGKENLVDLTYRYSAITQHRLRMHQLEGADRILRPDVTGVEWFDFKRLEELVEAGHRAVPERIR